MPENDRQRDNGRRSRKVVSNFKGNAFTYLKSRHFFARHALRPDIPGLIGQRSVKSLGNSRPE
jgi:hypothetical protein